MKQFLTSFVSLLFALLVGTSCSKSPKVKSESSESDTNNYLYTSLSIYIVSLSNLYAMKPFTGKVLIVEAWPFSNSLHIGMEKQAPYDHRSIILFETNADKEALALVTNLVVGQNYTFPNVLQPDSSINKKAEH